MEKYIIAIKRGKEKFADPEWTQRIQKMLNVELISNYRDKRIVVSTDEDGVVQIEKELSTDNFHIEPLIEHKRSTIPKFIKRWNTLDFDDESE
ncbi:hypothetical protein [Flagellimonas sp. 2504JD1-5]